MSSARPAMAGTREAGALGRPHRALWWQLLRLEAGGLANRCQRAARAFGDMVYAAYWWPVVGAIAALIWPLVVVLPRRPMRHAVIGTAARTLFRLTGTPLEVSAPAEVPDRAVILVVNH